MPFSIPFAALPIVYDATGAGASSISSTASLSYSHTATAGAAVVVGLAVGGSANLSSFTAWTRSVTYGGVSMTSLGAVNSGASGASGINGFLELFGLLYAPGGAQTVIASATQAGQTPASLISNAVSYTGVNSFGTAATASDANTATLTASVTVTSAPRSMAVAAIVAGSAMIGGNQTLRYLNNLTGSSRSGNLLIEDAPGASSVSFTAAISSSDHYGCVGVSLNP